MPDGRCASELCDVAAEEMNKMHSLPGTSCRPMGQQGPPNIILIVVGLPEGWVLKFWSSGKTEF